MKKIAFVLILFAGAACAQKQNNIWYFGANAGLDFNSGAPVALTNSAMMQSEGCASICDTTGSLLFYTDGVTVWNANHIPMPNGFGLLGNLSSTQSALIVPLPGDCSKYYLFTVPSQDSVTPLCYNIIDMNLNGGLGDVIVKNIPLHHPVNERLTATLHSKGIDYWIVTQEQQTNSIYSYCLSSAGLDTVPVISSFPSLVEPVNHLMGCLGYMKISGNGEILCQVSLYDHPLSVLFDFDNTTGIASNPIILTASTACYGVEFSPDNSRLYISTANSPFILWQYDLLAGSASAIQASALQLTYEYGSGCWGGALQLGPDGKIYINRLQKDYLDVIEQPNQSGFSCNYTDSVVYLAGRICYDGLPNLIKGYSSCTALSDENSSNNSFQFDLAPNPCNYEALLSFPNPDHAPFSLIIYNSFGAIVQEHSGITADKIMISKGSLKEGLYYFSLGDCNKTAGGKIIFE